MCRGCYPARSIHNINPPKNPKHKRGGGRGHKFPVRSRHVARDPSWSRVSVLPTAASGEKGAKKSTEKAQKTSVWKRTRIK